MEALSPGVAYGCFELLDLIDASPMLLENARGLGKLGVIPAHRITNCAIALGWAEVDKDGSLVATARGKTVRALRLTQQRLRLALMDIVDAADPPWAQNARFGRRRFLNYAPIEVVQVCEEAGLSESSDDETVAFWDALASRARGLRDVQLNEVGREGERLTIAHETLRTGIAPKWIALDSNEDGYDILSRVSDGDNGRLCIEVKASRLGMNGEFYVTRHEWDTAVSLINFQMHLWDLSPRRAKLAVLGVNDVEVHLPNDKGIGFWHVARVPFSAFSARFE